MKALVIDCNYICHATFHSMPILSFKNSTTSIVYGFVKRVISFAERFEPDSIVFVWDSKSSIRKEVYPDYKKPRIKAGKEASTKEKEAKSVAYNQFDEIRLNTLPSLGFNNVFVQDGYEGDDLMAAAVNCNPGYEFVVITTDKDMYQIIDDNCMLFNPMTKIIRDKKWFVDEFGCHPLAWGYAKAISGCSTDNVTGLKGVAEPTALKFLTGKLSKSSKKYEKIENYFPTALENRELVVLPMYGTMDIDIVEDAPSVRSFKSVCESYGFKSLLSANMVNKWLNHIC